MNQTQLHPVFVSINVATYGLLAVRMVQLGKNMRKWNARAVHVSAAMKGLLVNMSVTCWGVTVT